MPSVSFKTTTSKKVLLTAYTFTKFLKEPEVKTNAHRLSAAMYEWQSAHDMIEFRRLNRGDFVFVYVTIKSKSNPFFPPAELHEQLFGLLRTFPKSSLQLLTPWRYYVSSKVTRRETPLRISVVYEEDVESYLNASPMLEATTIIILDSTLKNQSRVIDLTSKKIRDLLFVLPDNYEGNVRQIRVVKTFHELLKYMKDGSDFFRDMVSRLGIKDLRDDNLPFSSDDADKFNTSVYFRPAQINYFTINQSVGNYWSHYKEENLDEIKEESTRAAKSKPNDLTRLDLLIDQIHKIDSLEVRAYQEDGVKFPEAYTLRLSPIVIVSSYNYPHLSDLFEARLKKDKSMRIVLKALGGEQRLNYTNTFPSREGSSAKELKEMKAVAHFHQNKASYLDGIAYLHASFTNSPTVRFPFLGNSLKRQLSFFRPDKVPTDTTYLKYAIDTFGEAYANQISPAEKWDQLLDPDRQVVAISDLPIEWLKYDGVPLIVSRDVTRMPENPLGGLMAYYVMNSTGRLEIGEDIMSKTLVLFCTSEGDSSYDDFLLFFEQARELSNELGFKTAICSSVAHAASLIEGFQPELLIFDCHGGYDEDSLSSYLWLGEEKLDGDAIVKNRISAPLVFLSACFTNPTYGYVNGIANAFFEAGSLAVTATYFPIAINSGSVLYIRLLKNLNYAATHALHENWLEFISHLIRTSYTISLRTTCLNKLHQMEIDASIMEELIDLLNNDLTTTNVRLMKPALRKSTVEAYGTQLVDTIKKKVPSFSIDLDSSGSEHLFYTNLGRSDLVKFRCWLKEYYTLNKLKEANEAK